MIWQPKQNKPESFLHSSWIWTTAAKGGCVLRMTGALEEDS